VTLLSMISGAMYSGVPHSVQVRPCTRFANPKSVTYNSINIILHVQYFNFILLYFKPLYHYQFTGQTIRLLRIMLRQPRWLKLWRVQMSVWHIGLLPVTRHYPVWCIVIHVAVYTHTHTQPFYGSVDFVRDNPGEPVPEETFTYSHSSRSSIIPICFLHLLRFMASSLFNPRVLQSFSTISLQVFFGLPLGVAPSTSYSIHVFMLLCIVY